MNPRIESKLLIYIHALHTIQKKQKKLPKNQPFLECNVITGISRPPHSFSSGDDFHERGGRNITLKHPNAEYHGIPRYITRLLKSHGYSEITSWGTDTGGTFVDYSQIVT